MAYVVARGKRFTAYYRDSDGRRRSAGTFPTRKEALSIARSLEGSKSHSTVTLAEHVEAWLVDADLLPMTKKNYESILRTHVLPILGSFKVDEIRRTDVREMLEQLRKAGVKASSRVQAKASLGSALEYLVEKDELEANPTHNVKIRSVEQAVLRDVLEPLEFKKIKEHLPNDASRLFASFLVLSGCRFGEATELRVKDINFQSQEIYVQRRASDLGAKYNNGERFRVIDGTKSGYKRVVVVSKALLADLKAHVLANKLGKNDLIFSKQLVTKSVTVEVVSRKKSKAKAFALGARRYQHGTYYAYVHGKCRCTECREAVRNHRQSEQSAPKARPTVNTTGHLPRDTWRLIWVDAIAKSEIGWSPRTHDLRHANATALLKNGVDVH
jgi:integrase